MTKRPCVSKEMRRVKTVVKAWEAGFIECVSWYIATTDLMAVHSYSWVETAAGLTCQASCSCR